MDRFWEKVRIGSKEDCWIWTAGCDRDGRGRFKLNGTTVYAPRVSWELYYGPIPEGLYVLHRCDNPSCVNHNHLFLGTLKDNAIDRNLKGRNADITGEKNPSAKTSEKEAQEIIDMLNDGYSLKSIKEAGYSWNCAQNIKYMKAWTHLPGAGGWKEGSVRARRY